MRVRIKRLRESVLLPDYAHGPEEDAGMDLRAATDVVLPPGEARLVPTGLAIEVPPGFEAQVRPRSGLALKHCIVMPNAPGTIDPGYRGEVQVILMNLGREPYLVRQGDRVAQLVVARFETIEWEESELGDSARGEAGFGSTGR